MGRLDLEFIDKVKIGEADALEHIRKLCYSHIYAYTKDNDITKELVAQVMEKIVKSIKRYKPQKGKGNIEGNFKKWLNRISRNVWLDYRERKKREITFSELANTLGISDEDSELLENNFERLEDMLSLKIYQSLPHRNNPEWTLARKEVFGFFSNFSDSRKKVALILKFIYGMTTKQVAEIMNENFDSIQTTIHRSKKELKNQFIARGIDADYLNPVSWRL